MTHSAAARYEGYYQTRLEAETSWYQHLLDVQAHWKAAWKQLNEAEARSAEAEGLLSYIKRCGANAQAELNLHQVGGDLRGSRGSSGLGGGGEGCEGCVREVGAGGGAENNDCVWVGVGVKGCVESAS